jgi:hypothetical protein
MSRGSRSQSNSGKKNDTGYLRRNEKRRSDKDPEYRGSAIIDDVEYWVAGWINDDNGDKYMTCRFTMKEERRPKDDFDDDIPF